jgi:hypothetical protein
MQDPKKIQQLMNVHDSFLPPTGMQMSICIEPQEEPVYRRIGEDSCGGA